MKMFNKVLFFAGVMIATVPALSQAREVTCSGQENGVQVSLQLNIDENGGPSDFTLSVLTEGESSPVVSTGQAVIGGGDGMYTAILMAIHAEGKQVKEGMLKWWVVPSMKPFISLVNQPRPISVTCQNLLQD